MEWLRDNLRVLVLIVLALGLAALVGSKHLPKHSPAPHTAQTKSSLAGKVPASWTGKTKILGAASVSCRKLHLDATQCRTLPRKLTASFVSSSGRVLATARLDRNSQFTMHLRLAAGDYTAKVSGARLSGQTPVHLPVVPKTQPVLVVVAR